MPFRPIGGELPQQQAQPQPTPSTTRSNFRPTAPIAPSNSLTPKSAPSFEQYKKDKGFLEDTLGEGLMSFGTDLYQGAGKMAGGVRDIGGGIIGGIGNILQGRAATTQQAEQMVSGMGSFLSGSAQALFSPTTAAIKALPQQAQEPIEYGFGKIGEGLSYGMDLAPRVVGGAVSGIGSMTGQQGMQQTGQRISQSVSSPEWQNVKSAAMMLPVVGAMTRTLPKIPVKMQEKITLPGEKMIQGAVGVTKAGGSLLKNWGGELFSKAVLKKPIVTQLKKQAVKNENIVPALQGKVSMETVIPKAVGVVDDMQRAADVLRENTVSYLKKLEENKIKAGKSPLIAPRMQKVDRFLDEFGLARTSKGLVPKSGDVTKTPLTSKQISKFDEVVTGMSKQQMTPLEFWNMRSKLGEIVEDIKSSGKMSEKMKGFTDGLYNAWNDAARNQIKGLSKRDAQLHKSIVKLSPVKKLFYDKEGNLLPNEQITQGLEALTGKARARFEELKSLEKVIPGIGKELKAINLTKQVEQEAGPMAGQYLKAALQGGAGVSALSGNFPVAAALTTLSAATSPKNIGRAIVETTKKTQQAKQFVQKKIAPTASKVGKYIQNRQPWEIPGDVLQAVRSRLMK